MKRKLKMKKQNNTFKTISLILGCTAFLPQMQAVSPAPDGCYPGFTTAEGCNALKFLTTGAGNTGVGWYSLYVNTTGNYNTGVGAGTLILNTADSNTAVGTAALLLNTTGSNNTAVGTDALGYHDTGSRPRLPRGVPPLRQPARRRQPAVRGPGALHQTPSRRHTRRRQYAPR